MLTCSYWLVRYRTARRRTSCCGTFEFSTLYPPCQVRGALLRCDEFRLCSGCSSRPPHIATRQKHHLTSFWCRCQALIVAFCVCVMLAAFCVLHAHTPQPPATSTRPVFVCQAAMPACATHHFVQAQEDTLLQSRRAVKFDHQHFHSRSYHAVGPNFDRPHHHRLLDPSTIPNMWRIPDFWA